MRRITVEAEVDLRDCINEISTGELVEELERRRCNQPRTSIKSNQRLLLEIRKLLGLRDYHTNDRLIEEIKELVKYEKA